MTTSTTRTPIPDPALGQSVPKQVPAARNGGYFYGRATPGEMEVLCSFSPRQSPPCRPLLWPWAPVSACGALLICWRVMDRTTQVPMLMYGKEASNRKQEIDRQHHTIPNQRNQRPKDKHCGNVHNWLWNHG